MNNKFPPYFRYLKWSVLGILIFRFVLLIMVPLLDKTEARYAEIARLMWESGEWVVLQLDYGFPFWAKPPLSTWLSAGSFKLLGVSEFAARLPSYLMGLGVVALVWPLIQKKKYNIFLLGFVLLTTPEFLIHMGVVSTDSALLLGITLLMVSFWKMMHSNSPGLWGRLMFVGVAIGMLAKGPIVLILTLPPIFLWCVLEKKRLWNALKATPWLSGILILVLLAGPWYYLIEQNSPGFSDYFFVGEHFKRFTESGWEGDKYGFAKSQPLGMIWLFLLLFTFPWIQFILFKIWKLRRSIRSDSWALYLVFWIFWTPLFFTASKNSIHTYILPCTVPIGLLVLHWWKDKRSWIRVGSIFPIACALAFIGLLLSGKWQDVMNTDKYLLEARASEPEYADEELYYWRQLTYSGRFYSNSEARVIDRQMELLELGNKDDSFWLVVLDDQFEEIPEAIQSKLTQMSANGKRGLYQYHK